MEKTVSVKKNVFFNSLYTILNIIFPLITFPYASRRLLAEGMGKVTFYTSVANYIVMLGSLGISTYGIRKVAQERTNNKKLTKTIEELFLLNMFFSIVFFLILVVLSIVIPRLRSDYNLLLINYVYILLAPLGVDWAYAGLEQYKYITYRSFVCKLLSLVLLVIFVHDESDYINYALILAFSGISAWIMNFFHINTFIDKPYKVSSLEFKMHIKPMLTLFSSLLAVGIYTNVDNVMLGFIAGDEQVGYYTVATKIKTAMLSLVNSISAVLLPRMSFYMQNGENDLFRQTLRRSISIIFCIAIPCTVFFEISATETIFILGGEGYKNSIACMQIIMPVLLISGFSNITGNQILIPSGKDRAFMMAVSGGAIFDIILNALLMPKYLAKGAAIATLMAELVQMSIQVWFSIEYLKKNIDFRYIFGVAFYCCIIGLLVKVLFINAIFSNTIVLFILKGICFFLLYFIFLIAKSDRILFMLFERCKK